MCCFKCILAAQHLKCLAIFLLASSIGPCGAKLGKSLGHVIASTSLSLERTYSPLNCSQKKQQKV